MADLLRSDRDLAPSFLNSVLNQLNWAFSEFIGMIQEVGVSQGTHRGSGHTLLGWEWQPSFGKGLLLKLCPLLGRSSRQQSAWRGTLWTAGS